MIIIFAIRVGIVISYLSFGLLEFKILISIFVTASGCSSKKLSEFFEELKRLKIKVQKPCINESYAEFLQADVAPDKRKKQGLEEVFQTLFPIKSVSGNAALSLIHI